MCETRTTKLGTPCSSRCEAGWIACVERAEEQAGHRICGARGNDGSACTLAPAILTHEDAFENGAARDNGRCRFHWGHPDIGAPKGNRNALIHGLYSRRLQQCGTHCPLWQMCPMSGDDVLALPEKKRPVCVYEQHEYDALSAALTGTFEHDEEEETDEEEYEDKADEEKNLQELWQDIWDEIKPKQMEGAEETSLVHENVALLQVMLTRATAALGWHGFTETTEAEGEHYRMRSTKASVVFQACERIARELRQWVKLLADGTVMTALGCAPPSGDDDGKPPIGLGTMIAPYLNMHGDAMEKVARNRQKDYDGPGAQLNPRKPRGPWERMLAEEGRLDDDPPPEPDDPPIGLEPFPGAG